MSKFKEYAMMLAVVVGMMLLAILFVNRLQNAVGSLEVGDKEYTEIKTLCETAKDDKLNHMVDAALADGKMTAQEYVDIKEYGNKYSSKVLALKSAAK